MYHGESNKRQRGYNEDISVDLRMVQLHTVVSVADNEMLVPDNCSETLL